MAVRLWRAGFRVLILEVQRPMAVRRTVAFSEAMYDGRAGVEEVQAERADRPVEIESLWRRCVVPVALDPEAALVREIRPYAVVDAILAKRNTGTAIGMAPVVVGLGPGFDAGRDVTAVVETNRGPDLGRVIWKGPAQANTGEPAEVQGHGRQRVLRAPRAGVFAGRRSIGDIVREGEVLADVGSEPVVARFDGLIRGLLRTGTAVDTGMKVGDIDPRKDPSLCWKVSDKSLAIAGGVLEAILMTLRGNE